MPLDGREDAVYTSNIIGCEGLRCRGGTAVYLEFEPTDVVELYNVTAMQVVYQLFGQFGQAGQNVGALKAALPLYVCGYLGGGNCATVNGLGGKLAVVAHLGAKGLYDSVCYHMCLSFNRFALRSIMIRSSSSYV